MSLPTRVLPSIGIRSVGLRNFRSPYFESFCNNCTWSSFMYATEDEAAEAGESHAQRCCERLNMEKALTVEVVAIHAEQLERGHHVLLRDLRTMLVDNVILTDDRTAEIFYSIDGLEGQILSLPFNHIVKVVN